MIRGHGNIALSGHDHSPFRGGLYLLRLRLGGEKKADAAIRAMRREAT
jgi:hypothetical protein